MATTKSAVNERTARAKPTETPSEITNDVLDFLIDYARKNPGYAALYCFGIGFVLGWKLKPW